MSPGTYCKDNLGPPIFIVRIILDLRYVIVRTSSVYYLFFGVHCKAILFQDYSYMKSKVRKVLFSYEDYGENYRMFLFLLEQFLVIYMFIVCPLLT